MHKVLKKLLPRPLYDALAQTYLYLRYSADFIAFKTLAQTDHRFRLRWSDRLPQLFDNTGETHFDTHYIYHPAWAARVLANTKPDEHVDIASTLSFSSLLSSFIPVRFYDYRPAPIWLTGLTSGQVDLRALPFSDGSIRSLSCMHTLEHVGLGRYGDPLEPKADIRAAAELSRVLARGGDLLFAVPIGRPKIAFNAHRVYSYAQVVALFPALTLKRFSLIPDDALSRGMIDGATEEEADTQEYGCGCFWFTKA